MARKNNSTQPWELVNRKRSKKNRVLLSTFVNTNDSENDNNTLLSKPSPPIVVTQDIMAQRSRSFAYGTRTDPSASKSVQHARIYAALLSKVAIEFRQRIILTDNVKDDIEYKNTFDGKEAVDKIAYIIQTSDRQLALRIGRTLSEQRFFHDVSYETQLVDSALYFYEFSNRALYIQNNDTNTSPPSTSARTSDWSEGGSVTTQNDEAREISSVVPIGVITELAHCYVPTCWDIKPCYSSTCPKRLSQFKRSENNEIVSSLLSRSPSGNILKQSLPTSHDLWADGIDKSLYDVIEKTEKRRQENIYELIYTEEDYVNSLEYLQTMWIKPLMERPIIPLSRRESFINKVFTHISSIYDINICMLQALQARQKENPIVHQIGDILLAYVSDFEPYIKYGSKQYEAKFALENELFINSNFSDFVEETERHPSSLKLELNGYLTKPTTRLGRYTLLFNEILKHTPLNHPDQENLPKAVSIIKQFLSRVNAETGRAKNRFDLERISYNLSFKHKSDEVNLDLLNRKRSIIKQGLLKRTSQVDSPEYQVILFDHYLVVVKIKILNGTERYVVQKKPIPVELLSVYLPDTLVNSKRSSTLLPYLSTTNTAATIMVGNGMYARAATDIGPQTNSSLALSNSKSNYFPISFRFIGGRNGSTQFTLFATSLAIRKPWIEKIRRQQEEKDKRRLIFEMAQILGEYSFYDAIRINYFITFNGGNQYLFAANDGVYVGHHNNKIDKKKKPHKVLSISHVTQVQVIESTQTLLVLAERVLWEYPLDVVNGKPENQPLGYKIQTHVPFFCVGQCMQRTMVCIPRVSTLKSTISSFEPVKKTDGYQQQGNGKRNSGLLDRLIVTTSRSQSSEHPNLRKIKDCYVPSEAYRVELSPSMMLITTAIGIIMVDMRTDKPQQLLNPADRKLGFILEREKEDHGLNLRQPIKRISIFRTPRNHYFVCYDEYAFYIDSKGNRLFPNFLIEWEGSPEAYAFSYPYVMAFDSSFIEIRNVISGGIEQIIRGKNIKCLNNGNKTELALIFVTMADPLNELYRVVFSLQLTQNASQHLPNTYAEPSTLRRYKH